MDNEKKRVPMIIGLALISFALAVQLYLIITYFLTSDGFTVIREVMVAIALLSAFMYVFSEYKKSSSDYFKLFIASYAVVLISFILAVTGKASLVVIIIAVLELALLIMLFITKNLGKENSVYITLAILVLELAIAIDLCLNGMPYERAVTVLILLSRLTLPVVLVNMMFLKYSDKKMRGRE